MTCGLVSASETSEMKGLKIKLISEQKVVSPGATITVGVSIKHDEGFHTYWRNPGNVGMATGIKWKLPEGFLAESIQWPCPELCLMAGHPCHGYERDVVLLVDIKVPEKLFTNEVKLIANVAWMCCADDCHPGFKELSIILPVGEKSIVDEKHAVVFATARKELPIEDCPWEVVMLSGKDEPVVKVRVKQRSGVETKKVPEYIFSDDGQVSSDKEQKFTKQADASYIMRIDRSEYSPKFKNKFSGVLKVGNHHYTFLTDYEK